MSGATELTTPEVPDIEADVAKCSLVFVYGTLKRGEPNHHWLTEIEKGSGRLVSPAVSEEKYPLVIASRYNIPYLLNAPGQGKNVEGELYEVDGKMLANLDVLEAHPKYYRREIRKFLPVNDSSSDASTEKSESETADTVLPTSPGDREVREAWVYLLHTFKPAMLQLPTFSSYSSRGDHGLTYVTSEETSDPEDIM